MPLYSVGVEEEQPPVVRIRVTYQTFDPFQPWQKGKPGTRHGYGVLLDTGRVLTTESLIRNHTLVELSKARSGERILACVESEDCHANVAMLRLMDTNSLRELPTLSLAEGVPLDAKVEILQFDKTTQLQRGEGQVVRILVDSLPQAPYQVLLFNVLTDLNVDGQGAAVVYDGALAGLIISYDRSRRMGKMLPYGILKHFVEDSADGDYAGFASAGIIWRALVDPAKRRYLGLTSPDTGIQILSSLRGTHAFEILKPNDVVIAWDGHNVDSLGFYDDPEFGRLAFPHLIKGRREPGDTALVRIVRDGREQELSLRLGRARDSAALIPENTTAIPEEYLIDGGLVIRELTGHFLRAHGSEWETRVDSRLVHLYSTRRHDPEREGDRVLVLSMVLPDSINIGYQDFRDQIIEKVNGEEVRNIQDVFRIVDRDGSVRRLTLKSIDVDIVLDERKLPEANSRLSRQYRLPSLRREMPPSPEK